MNIQSVQRSFQYLYCPQYYWILSYRQLLFFLIDQPVLFDKQNMKLKFSLNSQKPSQNIKRVLQPYSSSLFQYFNHISDRSSFKSQKKQDTVTNHRLSLQFFDNLIDFLSKSQTKGQFVKPSSDAFQSDDQQQYQDQQYNQKDQVQTTYSFLRNIWGSHYFNRTNNFQNNQDRLDKINKIVAMMKQRVNYMSKKQSYLYQKEELQMYKRQQLKLQPKNCDDKSKIELGIYSQYIFNNSVFQKFKEDSQKVKIEKEQLKIVLEKLKQQINETQGKNKQLQSSFRQIKKKNQQLQLRLIQNGKKTLNLEREIMDLKSDAYKLKVKARQLDDIKSACSDSAGKNYRFNKQQDENVTQQNGDFDQSKTLLRVSSGVMQDNHFKSIVLKDKLHSYNQKEDRLAFKSVFKSTYRYSSKLQDNQPYLTQKVKQNEEDASSIKQPLRITTHAYQNQAKLALSSSKICFKQQMPLKFRYIKQSGSARKSMLSSVKSMDSFDKQSISKLRFQRTKVVETNIQKNGRKCSEDFGNVKSGMIGNIKKKCWAINQKQNKLC